MDDVVSINCSDPNSDGQLEDLTPLSMFPGLTSLVADGNKISSVDAIPCLPKLQVCAGLSAPLSPLVLATHIALQNSNAHIVRRVDKHPTYHASG